MALKISSHHCGMERSAGLPVWCKVCDCCRDIVAVSTHHWYTQLTGSFLTNGATEKVVKYRILLLSHRRVGKIQSMLWDIFFELIIYVVNRERVKNFLPIYVMKYIYW